MARAFEVEHTTAIYSGILRMADLLALQPNMDIRLHIVAPEARKQKVFDEIRRPVSPYLKEKLSRTGARSSRTTASASWRMRSIWSICPTRCSTSTRRRRGRDT